MQVININAFAYYEITLQLQESQPNLPVPSFNLEGHCKRKACSSNNSVSSKISLLINSEEKEFV